VSSDQYTPQDPTTQYEQPDIPEQVQEAPGLAKEMQPKPDHGEETYRGSGRLAGRKALITGADSGIGRAVAIAFAREGADLVLSYLPEEQPDADEVVALAKDAGRTVVTVPGDLGDETYCEQLVQRAVDELGGLDLLVLVAGKQVATQSLAEITTEQLEQTFRTNVYSMFWVCKAALPHLRPGSSIINTASIQAYQPSPTLLDYAATKAAIVNFTKGLAQQLAEKGIRVNVVAPGPFWTPLQVSGGQPTEALPTFGEQAPLGRAGQPAELGPVYVFLASQESSYITGETLGVTGGSLLP